VPRDRSISMPIGPTGPATQAPERGATTARSGSVDDSGRYTGSEPLCYRYLLEFPRLLDSRAARRHLLSSSENAYKRSRQPFPGRTSQPPSGARWPSGVIPKAASRVALPRPPALDRDAAAAGQERGAQQKDIGL